jgi:hypothetical protein
MKSTMIKTAFGVAMISCAVSAFAAKPVDVSNDGIYQALTTSKNLQATVNKLMANGANQQSVIAIAAAAGISESKVLGLQVCSNTAEGNTLTATCMRQQSITTAYATGANDPLSHLPATAAGKKAKK